jgi:hypothetical protein
VAEGPLLCPRCATHHPLDLSACPQCGTPLTYQGPPGDEAAGRRERARKVLPQYTDGPPVTVATGRNLAEADFIAGLLLEEGIPSLVRRSAGADVPEMLAAGARDVLVPASGAQAARQTLLQAELHDRGGATGPSPGRLLAGLLAAVAGAALVIWILSLVQG